MRKNVLMPRASALLTLGMAVTRGCAPAGPKPPPEEQGADTGDGITSSSTETICDAGLHSARSVWESGSEELADGAQVHLLSNRTGRFYVRTSIWLTGFERFIQGNSGLREVGSNYTNTSDWFLELADYDGCGGWLYDDVDLLGVPVVGRPG